MCPEQQKSRPGWHWHGFKDSIQCLQTSLLQCSYLLADFARWFEPSAPGLAFLALALIGATP